MKLIRCISIIFLVLLSMDTFSQVYSNKVVGKKNEELKDSLESMEYPYILPIWGAKATAKGFHLPYSAGLGINYVWQESELVISNLSVGFNDSPLYDLSQVVRFNGATATASAWNFRPDVWLFPFLNVYGIMATANTSTAIDAGIYVPDSTNTWHEVTAFKTKAEFDAKSFGFGITPTIGIGGGWMALDFNMAWSDVSALDKPVFTTIFGPRFGKSFKFKKNPDSNVAIWVGGFRVSFSSDTQGQVYLSDLVDEEGTTQAKIDEGMAKVEATQTEVDEWWNGLSDLQQNNPVNEAKYAAANRALDAAGTLLNGMDGALSTIQSSTINYTLEKDLKDAWNFIVGSQFQINRHFMIRAEYGFLGSRQQFIGGLQYRFGL